MQLKTFFSTLYGSGTQSHAMRFVLLLGVVSLFADMTYEGARSISGAYLAVLGASAVAVGIISGASELVGYALRLVFGYLADRSRQYWLIALSGYAINLLAVPLLALTNNWWMAAILMVLERFGKAVRTPARDTLLSQGGKHIGMGWAFGLHEALDQTGAMLGPLIVAIVLYFNGSYQEGFAWLAIPALLALWILIMARGQYPKPDTSAPRVKHVAVEKIWSRPFILYLIGTGLIAFGFADFPMIAFHFQKTGLFTNEWIPILYAASMGINIFLAPIMGHIYDRVGVWVIIIITGISAFFAPLAFLGSAFWAGVGVILWGVGMGTQGSLLRAVVGDIVGEEKRATAYGIFNVVFGFSWFLGSAIIGFLYEISLVWMVMFILLSEAVALFWLFLLTREKVK